jgi:hypothetical protein
VLDHLKITHGATHGTVWPWRPPASLDEGLKMDLLRALESNLTMLSTTDPRPHSVGTESGQSSASTPSDDNMLDMLPEGQFDP